MVLAGSRPKRKRVDSPSTPPPVWDAASTKPEERSHATGQGKGLCGDPTTPTWLFLKFLHQGKKSPPCWASHHVPANPTAAVRTPRDPRHLPRTAGGCGGPKESL